MTKEKECECQNKIQNFNECMDVQRIIYIHDDVNGCPVYICTLKCKNCGREIEVGI
jgi:hypothetical protein